MQISNKGKNSNQEDFRIMVSGSNHKPMLDLSKQAGWNQTEQDLSVLTSRHPESSILAMAQSNGDYIPVGSGLVISAGDTLAWIGMILVDKRYRRRGAATALMKECLHLARLKMKTSVVGLDATASGLQVYERLGFKTSFRIWRCVIPTKVTEATQDALEIVVPADLSVCREFIKKSGLEQKWSWFELIHCINRQGLWCAKGNGEITGMVMTRPGRLKPFVGPLVAGSVFTAKCLLGKVLDFWNQQGHEEVFADIPENHFQTASRWENERVTSAPAGCRLSNQAEISRCLVRMYEQISDEDFQRAMLQAGENEEMGYLQSARAAYNSTLDYMRQEQQLLPYIFATGGPELS